MATISDLRLVTLLPTKGQTIYVYNVNNPTEYYTESFFARMGTTWAFCVVPDRNDNEADCWVNIVQTDNQTITLNALIPDIAIEEEFRAGILNYYSENLADRYTYTIGYQDIRVYTTPIGKSNLEVEYRFIDVEQVDHQLILIVSETGATYSYGVSLPYNTAWKAVLICEPGYHKGNLTLQKSDSPIVREYDEGEIISGIVTYDLTVSATDAIELYTEGTLKPGLFDSSDINYSNSDGYLQIGVGTETNKDIQTIMLYTEDKMFDDNIVQLGTASNKLLYAAVGTYDHPKATRLVYATSTQRKYVLSSIEGYYGFDYILGYSQLMVNSSFSPTEYRTSTTSINITAFGFCAEEAPVNDATVGYWFLVIDPPPNDQWSYIKIMLFDNNKKVFSMIAYKDFFEEISEGKFIGQYIYKQGSKNGINDDAYIILKDKFNAGQSIKTGVYFV